MQDHALPCTFIVAHGGAEFNDPKTRRRLRIGRIAARIYDEDHFFWTKSVLC